MELIERLALVQINVRDASLQAVAHSEVPATKRKAKGYRSVTADVKRKVLQVDVNGVAFSLKCAEAFPEQAPPTPAEQQRSSVAITMPRFEGETSHELNLVGLHVDEALPKRRRSFSHPGAADGWSHIVA